jgi:hypothetical protein
VEVPIVHYLIVFVEEEEMRLQEVEGVPSQQEVEEHLMEEVEVPFQKDGVGVYLLEKVLEAEETLPLSEEEVEGN